jgi:hypothetical protein
MEDEYEKTIKHQKEIELVGSVKSEVQKYQKEIIENGKLSFYLRSNKELGEELGKELKRKPFSRSYITALLEKYEFMLILKTDEGSFNLRVFRQNELYYKSTLSIRFQSLEEKIKYGTTGGYNTKGIKKTGLTKEFIEERGRNGGKKTIKLHGSAFSKYTLEERRENYKKGLEAYYTNKNQ